MFTQGLSYQKTITMVTEICCNCGIAFGMPSDFQENCRNDPGKYFHCPNGHRQHYSKSKEQRLREEAENNLQKVKDALAQKELEKVQIEGQLITANRKLKRVSRGVCPCCNRTFANLHNHIKTKHPETIK